MARANSDVEVFLKNTIFEYNFIAESCTKYILSIAIKNLKLRGEEGFRKI